MTNPFSKDDPIQAICLQRKMELQILGRYPQRIDQPDQQPDFRGTVRIGSTGRDVKNNISVWYGFDVDAPSKGNKGAVTAERLAAIDRALSNVPEVLLRRSTGGAGRHFYLFPETPPPAKNREQHTANAKRALDWLCEQTSLTPDDIDKFGQVLWCYATDAGPGAFQTIKLHTAYLPPLSATAAPSLCDTAYPTVKLTDLHERVISVVKKYGCSYFDGTFWQIHSGAIKVALPELRDLGIVGLYDTNSTDGDRQTQNVYGIVLPAPGQFDLRTHGGRKEHPLWDGDRIILNQSPDLKQVARVCDGKLDPKGRHVFPLEKAAEAVEYFGVSIDVPQSFADRQTTVSLKDDRLTLEMPKRGNESAPDGWIESGSKWQLTSEVDAVDDSAAFAEALSRVFYVVDDRGESTVSSDEGGYYFHDDGNLRPVRPEQLKRILKKMGVDKQENVLIARSDPVYDRVYRPLEPIVQDDCINAGAQLRFKAADEPGGYPLWLSVLGRPFECAAEAIKADPWCQENGILTPEDYGFCDLAHTVKDPRIRLPIKAMYSGEDEGKTTLIKATARLFTGDRIIASCGKALEAKDKFIDPEGAIIIAVEDAACGSPEVENWLKEWATEPRCNIRKMYRGWRTVDNFSRIFMASNHLEEIPAYFGTSRIMVLEIPKLENKLHPQKLEAELDRQAPYLMRAIADYTLPEPAGRIAMPVLETEIRERIQRNNAKPIELFLRDEIKDAPNDRVQLKDFRDKLNEYVDENELGSPYSYKRINAELPPSLKTKTVSGKAYLVGVAL